MDYFELAVDRTLGETWNFIEKGVNDAAQIMSGRSGSSIAEDVILRVMENLSETELYTLKITINSKLVAAGIPYSFKRYGFRSKTGNKEAQSRSIEDVMLYFEKDKKIIDAYINIKVSSGKKGQADNSCSWRAAAYSLYGKINVSRRDEFLKITEDFSVDDSHNYFFWVLLKNDTATQLSKGHVNSLLSIDPAIGMRFNINQPFPIQIVHATDASLSSAEHWNLPLKERRRKLHSWLTLRMADKYEQLSSTVITSLSSHSTKENLTSYLTLLESTQQQAAALNKIILGVKTNIVQDELTEAGIMFDSIVVENDVISAYHEGNLLLQRKLDDVTPPSSHT